MLLGLFEMLLRLFLIYHHSAKGMTTTTAQEIAAASAPHSLGGGRV